MNKAQDQWAQKHQVEKNACLYAFAMKGTVLDALGLASMIYTISSFIANCIFIRPTREAN